MRRMVPLPKSMTIDDHHSTKAINSVNSLFCCYKSCFCINWTLQHFSPYKSQSMTPSSTAYDVQPPLTKYGVRPRMSKHSPPPPITHNSRPKKVEQLPMEDGVHPKKAKLYESNNVMANDDESTCDRLNASLIPGGRQNIGDYYWFMHSIPFHLSLLSIYEWDSYLC